jgi:hypothetical protein
MYRSCLVKYYSRWRRSCILKAMNNFHRLHTPNPCIAFHNLGCKHPTMLCSLSNIRYKQHNHMAYSRLWRRLLRKKTKTNNYKTKKKKIKDMLMYNYNHTWASKVDEGEEVGTQKNMMKLLTPSHVFHQLHQTLMNL